jgi:hypothetical protein
VAGHAVHLVRVDPYPRAGRETPRADYRATLEVL